MKSRFDEKSGATISYNDTRVVVKLFNEGTAWIFTKENFQNLLTFLNESSIIIGREDVLSKYKDGN